MTAEEWDISNDVGLLLKSCKHMMSNRKMRYYATACCRRISPLLPDPGSLRGVDIWEDDIEGLATEQQLNDVSWQVERAAFGFDYATDPCRSWSEDNLSYWDRISSRKTNNSIETGISTNDWQVEQWIQQVETIPKSQLMELTNGTLTSFRSALHLLKSAAYFVDSCFYKVSVADEDNSSCFLSTLLLRDIIANPFRPIDFDPNWRTSTAFALAESMYDAREFAAMSILADALEDAGCEDDAILSHCRGTGPHVRGCWVVDLVLDKQ